MTEKEKLTAIKAEIERLRHDWPKVISDGEKKHLWMYFRGLNRIRDIIDSLPEEPVSDDLEKAAERDVCGVVNNCSAIGMPNDHIPSWVQDAMINEFIHGAKWKEEQFEKNRLEHCNSITNEQAELEQKFLDEHLDKYNRMPTFLDAIEYGMRLKKEQMMKGAFEFAQKHNDACVLASECLRNHGWFNREHDFNDLFLYLSCVDELFAGKFSGKTKVIVIKED